LCHVARHARVRSESGIGVPHPQSPYAGKFVGLANGEIVVIADDFDTMIAKLRQLEPDPRKCYGLEASEDLTKVHEIWSMS
jgi:hypothetical protein